MPTCAAVIIGDEILRGTFPDENGPFVIAQLRSRGCDLGRLVFVSDTPEAIADEVARCAVAFDHVITTGGVGPTHDDRTLEGIARGLHLALEESGELVKLFLGFGLPDNEATRRMASLPAGAVLEARDTRSIPVIRVQNVWAFPGVPALFRKKFLRVADRFSGRLPYVEKLHSALREVDIAAVLSRTSEREPAVAIGSYPRFGRKDDVSVIVTLESRDEASLARAVARLREALPWLPASEP